MLLVAMVPFLTMAQKRSKKDKVETNQKNNTSKISYEFMVITGRAIMNQRVASDLSSTTDTRAAMESKLKITFDFGGLRTNDAEDLSSQQYKSMAHAVNTAARAGWEFVNANVERNQGATIHYYYMRKQK